MSATSQSRRGSEPLNGVSGVGTRVVRAARACVTWPIVLYVRFVSPALPRRCKYEPTCSAYALEAVRRYGVVRGLLLAVWRLLRCNPLSDGGFDPVEAQRLFRPRDPAAGFPPAGTHS